jgi:hypothetical protein
MITNFIGWIQAIFNYLVSGVRIQGAAYSVYSDERD